MLVVDASLVAAALFKEEHSNFARETLGMYLGLTAPDLLAWELGNVALKKVVKGAVQVEELAAFDEAFAAFEVELINSRELILPGELTRVAWEEDLTAYDAAYLQLARDRGFALGTVDRNLTKAGLRNGLIVHSPFA